MKRLSFLLISLAVVEAAFAHTPMPINKTSPPKAHQILNPSTSPQGIALSAEEWQEVYIARIKALKTNPDILRANQKLSDRMQAFQDKLDAAIVKLDPSVAGILTKIEAQAPLGSAKLTTPTSSQ